MNALLSTVRELEAWGDRRDWVGPDPYEALNARRVPAILRRSERGRQGLTQLVRLSPIDLRPALGIRPEQSAAALAHVAMAYAAGEFLPRRELDHKLAWTLTRLEQLRCRGFDQPCWGYHFDVQTRIFFYPRGAPNTIATSFGGLALIEAYERTGQRELLDQAEAVGDFFLRHVPQTESDTGAFFGYLVGDRTPIHNANMLVCALLARLHGHCGRKEFAEAAAAGVAYTISRQRPDGSWPYAERRGWDWVDGYHSGYVLDSLLTCVDAGVTTADDAALGRGLAYYRDALFLPDGTPRYTTTSTYPIDIQCVAQGIQTPTLAARRYPWARDLAWSVYRFASTRMRRRDGAFAFQRRRLWTNSTPHVRWGAAPMLLALAHLHRLEHAG